MKEERKRFVDNVKQDKSAVLALSFLILVLLVSITVQWIPIDPDKLDVLHSPAAPSLQHPFGTDDVGRDYFIRVLYGGRVSLLIGFLAMVMSMSIGVALGLISGYFGGIIDAVLMRLVDVISSIPWIIMVMVIGMLFGRGFLSLVLVIGLLSWMEIARLIRSEVLSDYDYGGNGECSFFHYGGKCLELPGTGNLRSDVQLGESATECTEVLAEGAVHGSSSRHSDYSDGSFL